MSGEWYMSPGLKLGTVDLTKGLSLILRSHKSITRKATGLKNVHLKLYVSYKKEAKEWKAICMEALGACGQWDGSLTKVCACFAL